MNRPTLDQQLDAIAERCSDLVDLLGDLALDVAHGGLELSPEQYAYLAAALGQVGVDGGAILALDLERTARREGGRG